MRTLTFIDKLASARLKAQRFQPANLFATVAHLVNNGLG
jgi:hypothetical protein